jgi:plastocyanin
MTTMDRAVRIIVTALAIGICPSCQLADDIDAPKCEKGYHPELQRCVRDEAAPNQIKISAAAGGTSCTGDATAQRPPVLEPASLTVKANEDFQFDNTDTVAHEVRGMAGEVWLTVPPQQLSAFSSIAKTGTWEYRLSGCAQGGTVVVE